MLQLYMDVHVKAAITAGVEQRGIDVVTAQEDDSRYLDDAALLQRATVLDRVLFSQDNDLLAIARSWQQEKRVFTGLIYGHQLAATVGRYVLELELLCTVLEPEEMVNRIEYVP